MKKVKVRIAVAVDKGGAWVAFGHDMMKFSKGPEYVLGEAAMLEDFDVNSGEVYYWVTAELEVPEVKEVEGQVEEES